MFSRLVWAVSCAALLSQFVSAQSSDRYSTKQRVLQIRQLAKTGEQAIPTIAQYLSDPAVDIRIEAVKGITKVGTEKSLDPLVKATRDNDSEVQIRATDGLVNFYMPGYVAKGALSGPLTRGVRQVKSFFSSRNEQVIAPDVTVLAEVAQALSGEITHGASLEGRANAARAAGILRAGTSVPALEQGLRSKDSDLIFESLVALQKIGNPAAGPSASFLARDLDDRVQGTALETIGVLHSLPSAPDVRSALTGARNIRLRRAAIDALAMLGIPGDRTIFNRYTSDSDTAVRSAALEGLGRIREPEDYPMLESAYNEPNGASRVHLAAAYGLVNEGKIDTAEFSPLTYLFENLDIKDRQNVAEAYLTELGRKSEVRKALFPLVQHATPDQKVSLCRIFSASQSNDVVPVLTTLSRDIDPAVSLAAAQGLRIVQARHL